MTGFGTAAGAKDIAGQRAVLPVWRESERTGDCPLGRAISTGHPAVGIDSLQYSRIAGMVGC
jgi:hypothetical protein